jgi:hypothetical protein
VIARQNPEEAEPAVRQDLRILQRAAEQALEAIQLDERHRVPLMSGVLWVP